MVLPSISPLSGRREGVTDVPPPPRFRPLVGPVTEVRIGAEQIIQGRIDTSMSLAKIAGIKYEQQFLNHLRAEYERAYVRPHLHFRDNGIYRTAIPDAVLFSSGPRITIFEVKSQHMPEAWWQLEKLYKPLLMVAFPGRHTRCVEVVKRFDPQMPWPGEFVRFDNLEEAVDSDAFMGVLRWLKKT